MQATGGVNLNRLAVFVAVVEAGSLSAAARRLGLAKTMVSAHMQRLEAEVGASLLLRSTRRQSLIEACEAFYEAARRIVHDAQEAISADNASLYRFTDVESATTTSDGAAPTSVASFAPIRWLAVNHPSPHPRINRPPHSRSIAFRRRGPACRARSRSSSRSPSSR